MPLYGRNRLSIADIESDLHDLIANHPRSHVNDEGEPVIPAEALVDIFTSYRGSHNSVELLSKEEEEMFLQFIQASPGLEATTKVLVEFIAFRTGSGDKAPESALSSDEGSESDSPHRGRRIRGVVYKATSRSSSSDSVGTSVYRPPSRPPSNGPPVPPKTPSLRDSVFDTSKRQRSTPLVNNAPSSWAKRPAPASRRKSDAGRGGSDSEVSSNDVYSLTPVRAFAHATIAQSGPITPMWGRRKSSQTRTSDPTSPTISHTPLNSPPLGSRPHSRSHSYPQNMAVLYDENDDLTISQPVSAENSLDEMSFLSSISSLPILKRDDDSDSDDEVQDMLVYDRSAAPSNASMDSQERVDVLNKTIDELRKKLSDTEKGLNRKVNDLELELEEAQEKLEELKAELIAARKEEKELKSKEVRFPLLVVIDLWADYHPHLISSRNKTKIRFQLSRQRYQNSRRASKTPARHTKPFKSNTKNNVQNQNDTGSVFAVEMPKSRNTLKRPLSTPSKQINGTRSSKFSRTGSISSPQISNWPNKRIVPWMTKRRRTCY